MIDLHFKPGLPRQEVSSLVLKVVNEQRTSSLSKARFFARAWMSSFLAAS